MKLKSNVLFTVAATALCFLSVVYMSCKKNKETFPCNTVTCYNGGYCSSGSCVCPYGYQDDSCGHSFSAKFIGTWSISQTVIKSSDTSAIGTDSTYNDSTSLSSTPTTFFVQSWLGNKGYTNVSCVVDTTLTNFVINGGYTPVTNPGYNINGGYGAINAANNSITGEYYAYYLNKNSLWETDTVSYTMTLIKAY